MVPSLDAVSKKTFVRLNRPNPAIDIQKLVKGIETFTKEYKGKVWLEVLIIPGFNNNRSDLLLLKKAIKKINPDLIQINTLDRPGTMSDIRPATKHELENVVEFLNFPNIQIIARAGKHIKARIKRKDVKAAILETIRRRPCTKKDLLQILGAGKKVIAENIRILEQEKTIVLKKQKRGVFYQTLNE